jgi:glycosyltransferase involved in cell wall biosynthesis
VPLAAIVSFRLGGTDGVAIEARKWAWALRVLGFEVVTVAGEGPVDRRLPGLAIGAPDPPGPDELTAALADADLVVVENLCSLPLNPPAADLVARACQGRPTVLHHHDLPWQRPQYADAPPPPSDPAWRHVTVNRLSQAELGARGIEAVTVYNTFDLDPAPGRRLTTRALLGLEPHERLVLQPTRALARKNVGGGVALAEALGATYWLLGPAEDGFGPELEALLGAARCPWRVGRPPGTTIADDYAACDAVVLPSFWEGFGNPAVESAVRRRPLAVGPYPVATELAVLGFEWFALDGGGLGSWLADPTDALLEHNRAVAARHFNLEDLPGRLAEVLGTLDVAA